MIKYRGEIFGKRFVSVWSVSDPLDNIEEQQEQRHDWLQNIFKNKDSLWVGVGW